ncbi:flavodoxin family protein [Sinanaerobacter sp. ZZT-01]|uniref:flavodoxin family protein n=1 Tax=Sinanaerobacter sp. ZZT-01 TaxID=3111540 RepID=UPI002D77DC32|nr:hypothetical protein [Sinanaerobacter sp. ZZT-01]WRR94429.1 hypothetical protein U5921_04750 [Sinanaerobacter sp. ZZT-01]
MKYKVFYFTRTGTSKRVAEKISQKLSCDSIEITDDMDWSGKTGFVKGGYYAMKKKAVKIQIHGSLEDAEECIVVTPLWADRVAPAIDTFLKTQKLDKVHLVVTSNGSTLKERSGYQSITEIVKKNKDEDACIQNLTEALLS